MARLPLPLRGEPSERLSGAPLGLKILTLVHLLNMDAVLATVFWALLLAKISGASPPADVIVLLGASVWLIYAGDHWLDGRKLRPGLEATARHRFHRRHTLAIACLWVLVFFTSLVFAVTHSGLGVWAAGLILAGLSLGHLIAVHKESGNSPHSSSKELRVALGFTLGTFLPVLLEWKSLALEAQMMLAAAAFGFAPLCALNCYAIAFWERDADRVQNTPSAAKAFPSLQPRLHAFGLGALIVAFLPAMFFPSYFTFSVTLVMSLLGLGTLNRMEKTISQLSRRVLADVAIWMPGGFALVILHFKG